MVGRPKTLLPGTCRACGKLFEKKKATQQFCNRSCWREGSKFRRLEANFGCGHPRSPENTYWKNCGPRRQGRYPTCHMCLRSHSRGRVHNVHRAPMSPERQRELWVKHKEALAGAHGESARLRAKRVEDYRIAYRKSHREEISAIRRRYQTEHSERLRQQRAKRYAEHREERLARRRQWAAEHREYLRSYNRAYLESHRAEHIARTHARRGAYLVGHTRAEWEAKKAEYDHRCAYCGCQPERLTKDHVIPISKADPLTVDRIDNILPVCRPCNGHKHNKSPIEFAIYASLSSIGK